MAPHPHHAVRVYRPAPASRFFGSEFACAICGERGTAARFEERDRSRAWFCPECTHRLYRRLNDHRAPWR